jgi:hypothetical protein
MVPGQGLHILFISSDVGAAPELQRLGENSDRWEELREAMAFDQGLEAWQMPDTAVDAFLDMETFKCKGEYVLRKEIVPQCRATY